MSHPKELLSILIGSREIDLENIMYFDHIKKFYYSYANDNVEITHEHSKKSCAEARGSQMCDECSQ